MCIKMVVCDTYIHEHMGLYLVHVYFHMNTIVPNILFKFKLKFHPDQYTFIKYTIRPCSDYTRMVSIDIGKYTVAIYRVSQCT